MTIILRYVPEHLVEAYKALGWKDTGKAPRHHGDYSHVMEWAGQGEPQEPRNA